MAEKRHSDHQYTSNRRPDSSETGQALSVEVHSALTSAAHMKPSPGRQAPPMLGSPSQSGLTLPPTTISRVSPIPYHMVSQAPGIGLFQGHGLVNILPGTSAIPPHPGSLDHLLLQQMHQAQAAQAAAAAYSSGHYDGTTGTALPRSISPQDRRAADTLTQFLIKAKGRSPKDSRVPESSVRILIPPTTTVASGTTQNRDPSPHRYTHSPRNQTQRLGVPEASGGSGATQWRYSSQNAQGKPASFSRTASPGKPRTTSPAVASKPGSFASVTFASRASPTPSKPASFAHGKGAVFVTRTTPPPPSSQSQSTGGKVVHTVTKPATYTASKPGAYTSGKPASYAATSTRTSPSPGKVIHVPSAQNNAQAKATTAYYIHNSPQSASNPPENRLSPTPSAKPAGKPQTFSARVTPPPAVRVTPPPHRVTPPPSSSRVTPPPPVNKTVSNGPGAESRTGAGIQRRSGISPTPSTTPPPPPPPSNTATVVNPSVSTLQQQGRGQDRFTPPPPPPPLATQPYPRSGPAHGRPQGGAPLLYSALAKPVNGLPPAKSKAEEEKENRFFSHVKEEEDDPELSAAEQAERTENPYNMRLNNLSHFPTSQTQRTSYRSHAVSILRAKAGCITSPAKSLDLLRQNLQKFINKELDSVIQSYVQTYFKPALDNVKHNSGEETVPEDSINIVCAAMLEEAKKMYVIERSVTPDISDNVSESGSTRSLHENKDIRATKHSLFNIRKRRGSSDSDASSKVARKRGRKPKFSVVSGRSTPSKQSKGEPVKREGAKWDPERLNSESQFVMGARANKALGLGNMRGRLYVKHPDLFKYCGDQDDKNWLHEHGHMPATGGKAYLLLAQDIHDLAASPEYSSPAATGVSMAGMLAFSVPPWMLDKMKLQMQAMRTDVGKGKAAVAVAKVEQKPGSQDAETDSTALSSGGTVEDTEAIDKLPFSSFGTDSKGIMPCSPTSLAGTVDEDDDDDDDDNLSVCPFPITAAFEISPAPTPSPAPSPSVSDIVDALDEDGGPLSAPFEMGLGEGKARGTKAGGVQE